jgi:hypothetical protein
LRGSGDSGDTPSRLYAGDVALLPHGHGHAVVDQPGSMLCEMPVTPPADQIVEGDIPGGSGVRTRLLCGAYYLNQSRPHPLL